MERAERDDDAAVVATILEEILEDLKRGALGSLEHYAALHPGLEAVVARVYREVTSESVDGASRSAPKSADSKIGRFQLLGELGRGGQAVVYRAEDPTLRRTVALKVLPVGAGLTDSTLKRFRREAEIASRLDHPGICPVYETGSDGGLTWIAMRCVEGETLASVIAAKRRAKTSGPDSGVARDRILRSVTLIEKVARTLHMAHEAGVVHRDVKPGNIMVLPDGDPVVLDFGLARQDDLAGSIVTQTGDVLGTPAYMSPEQLAGPAALVDRRTDVWALGVTLYECVTVERPFDESTRGRLETAIRNHEPTRLRRRDRHVPRDLEAVVGKALEKDLRRRYASAADFADDLHRVLMHEPVKARPAGAVLRAKRWAQRNPVGAALIVVLAAGLGTSLFLLNAVHAREQQTQAALKHNQALVFAQMAGSVVETDPRLALRFALAALDRDPTLVEAVSQIHHAVALDHPSVELRHGARVASLEVSPDGEQLLTASENGFTGIWSLRDGREIQRIQGASGWPASASWSPAGDLVLVCSGGGPPRVCRTDGSVVARLLHEKPVQTAVFSPDGTQILTGGFDGRARLFDLTGQQLREWPAHEAPIRALFSADGSRILTYAGTWSFDRKFEDFTARLWTRDAQPIGAPMRHRDQILHAAFSLKGDRVVTSSADHTAAIWDQDGHPLLVLSGHQDAVQFAAFSKDGSKVVTCGADRTANLWDAANGRLLHELRGHTHVVFDASFSSSDDLILTGAGDQQPRIWDADGFLIDVLRGHKSGHDIAISAFAPDRNGVPRMVTGSEDGTARIWDLYPAELPILHGHHGLAYSAAFSPDGSQIATGGSGIVRLWNRGGAWTRDLSCELGTAMCLDFSSDGRALVAGCWDRKIRIWELDRGDAPVVIPVGSTPVFVDFSPTEPLLVAAVSDRPASFWSRDGTPLRVFKHGPAAHRAIFSPDGRKILTGHHDGTARLWNLEGDQLQLFRVDPVRVNAVAFHPSGEEFLTGGHDGRVIRWSLDGHELGRMPGSGRTILSVAFSPDGTVIAASSMDGVVRLWTREGEPIAELTGHSAIVFRVVFSPDGSRLLTASFDGTCRHWFVRTEELLEYARSIEPGPFTAEDRRRYGQLLGAPPVSQDAASEEPQDVKSCNAIAWSLVEPGQRPGLADCQRAVTLATRAVALTEEKDADILQTLGVALCRAGRDPEAVLVLEKGDALRTSTTTRRSAIDHAFLAISRRRMKDASVALAELEIARRLGRIEPAEDGAAEAVDEAETVLGQKAVDPARKDDR